MTNITTYPNCSYVPYMRIEADPDIGGIGVSDTPDAFPPIAKGKRKLILS